MSPLGTLKTRITVPLSLAVARSVPALLSATCATGALCAWMMLVTDSETASKRSTSPDGLDAPLDEAGGVVEKGVAGDGSGDGYAR